MDAAQGVARMLRGVDRVGHLRWPVVRHDDVLEPLLGDRQCLLGHDQAVPGLFEFPLQEGQIVDHRASVGPPS